MTLPPDDKKKSAAKAAPAPVGKSAPKVLLAKLLDEGLIAYLETASSKNEAITALLAKLCQGRNLGQPDRFLAKVMEREAGPTTTLDTGLAIPHSRIDGLGEVVAILGLSVFLLNCPTTPKKVNTVAAPAFSPAEGVYTSAGYFP